MHPLFGLDNHARRAWLAGAATLFPYVTWLESCAYPDAFAGRFEWLWAAAMKPHDAAGHGWLLGHIPYPDHQPGNIALSPDFSGMFSPEVLVGLQRDGTPLIIGALPDKVPPIPTFPTHLPELHPRWDIDTYRSKVARVKALIREGDHYEMNLCFPFESAFAEPLHPALFLSLCAHSPAPFAAYVKHNDQQAFCASPERFLSIQHGKCVCQPIKGTAPRKQDPVEDTETAKVLQNNRKEQAENVMIVDLTRHDLYSVCTPESVKVPLLFEVQTFPHVHQLVSTITGNLMPGIHEQAAITQIFPPGSMTGAPKRRVRERILELEVAPRGWYAGSIGYISPDGDLDMNVVIRTLFQDLRTGTITYWAGSAITWRADADQEYAECLLKADAWRLWSSPPKL